jgi:hypothetical protein
MPIIWGARGVFYFTYRNLVDPKTNPECAELRPRVLDTVKRFSEIAPAIIAGEPLQEWTKSVKTTGSMEHKVFAAKDAAYLFCGVGGGRIRRRLQSKQRSPPERHCATCSTSDRFPNSSWSSLPDQGRIIEVK